MLSRCPAGHSVAAARTQLSSAPFTRLSLVEGTPAAACAAFPGFEPVSGARVALAYLRCLGSGITGQVLRV